MINIVIPMAGSGTRFKLAGYQKAKPFIDVNGISMIERVLDNLKVNDSKFTLIVKKEHAELEHEVMERIQAKYDPNYIFIESLTEGATCTVLFSHRSINDDNPLLIANCDQIVDVNINDFIQDMYSRELDGSILTFTNDDPKWSYASVDEAGLVEKVREKEVISPFATVGIYLFRSGKEFVEGAIDMIINNDRVNNEFYVCPVYNYLINKGLKVGIYNIPEETMHGTGTPDDLNTYLKKIGEI